MLAEAIKVKILGVNERCKQGCMGSVYVQKYHSICLFEGSKHPRRASGAAVVDAQRECAKE